jgi:Outer membrane protein beta-barrel domain
MKNLFFAIVLLFAAQVSHAQRFGFGLKTGLHSQVNNPSEDILIGDGENNYSLGVDDFKFGTQVGGYLRFGKHLFIQPEVMFNSNKVDYAVKQSNLAKAVYQEQYNTLDIPVLLGFKLGPIRAMAGPVGHYFLSSKSELFQLKDYDEKFKQMTFGYQAGLNVSMGRLSADLRYEGNFNNLGDHLSFGGNNYQFANSPARIIFGLNFALVK